MLRRLKDSPDPPALRAVSPIVFAESPPPPEGHPANFPEEKLVYAASEFQHTRSLRFNEVSKTIKNNKKKYLSTKEFIFLLLMKDTIDDRDCQTSLLIEEYLNNQLHPAENDWESLNDASPLEKFEYLTMSSTKRIKKNSAFYLADKKSDYYYRAAKCYQRQFPNKKQDIFFSHQQIRNRLQAVIALHRLISEKETQILGFKVIFRFSAEEKKIQREQQYQEIEDIFYAARYIYDTLWNESSTIPTSNSEAESASQEMDLEDIMQPIRTEPGPLIPSRMLKAETEKLPVAAQKIIDQLLELEPPPVATHTIPFIY